MQQESAAPSAAMCLPEGKRQAALQIPIRGRSPVRTAVGPERMKAALVRAQASALHPLGGPLGPCDHSPAARVRRTPAGSRPACILQQSALECELDGEGNTKGDFPSLNRGGRGRGRRRRHGAADSADCDDLLAGDRIIAAAFGDRQDP